MSYWRINTDRRARTDLRTCDLWFQHGMAFAGDYSGDKGEHAVYFPKYAVGDGVFMHESNAGIVGYGTVSELWNKRTYVDIQRLLYVKEPYEYRIAVIWQLDCRDDPVPIRGRLPYRGTCCRVDTTKWDVRSVLRDLRTRSRLSRP